MIKSIKGLSAAKKAVGSGPKVVIKFFAPWCSACNKIEGLYKKFSKQYTDVKFYQINIDENKDLTEHYKLEYVPTFFYYKNMKLKSRVDGSNEGDIIESMKEL